MNDTNTNKADDMNEDDVTLTGPEGENTAVESDAAADATADNGNRIPGCRRSERFERRYRTACSSPSSSTTTVTTPTPS